MEKTQENIKMEEQNNTGTIPENVRNEDAAQVKNKLASLAALKNKFISTVSKIYVNSLDREVNFREITVAEQKKLARIMIDNENRKDIVYDAQCATLKSICLEKDLDIYDLTEFDKIKLLLMIYQRNMTRHDVTFICPECHAENKYALDFQAVVERLNHFDTADREYVYENPTWKFKFTLGYPKIRRVSKFYSQRYLRMQKTTDKKMLESMNTQINVDYTNLFIKKIVFSDKTTAGEENVVDTADYTLDEFFDFISVFPQDVLYAENGIIQYITAEFITKINDSFEKHRCIVCKKLVEQTSDSSAEGFF